MDHAINQLKNYMNSYIMAMHGTLTKDEIKDEITVYVKAINELEQYYYGQAKTTVKAVLEGL